MAIIEFNSLTSFDSQGHIIIDVNSPQLIGKQISIRTANYLIDCWHYNATKCYTCADKKDSKLTWVLPVMSKYISSYYGPRPVHPITKLPAYHYGIDLGGGKNRPILAARAGKIVAAGYGQSSGHYVIIEHYADDNVQGRRDGFKTEYMHMGPATRQYNKDTDLWIDIAGAETGYKHIVEVGQWVSAGQIIGAVGTSGGSTGPHLHFGILKDGIYVNPQDHIDFTSDNADDVSAVENVRIQKDKISYNDFVPMFSSSSVNNFVSGSSYMYHIRRHNLIKDASVSLFDYGKLNERLGIGSGCIGPSVLVDEDITVELKLDDDYLKPGVNPFIGNIDGRLNVGFVWAKAMKISELSTNPEKIHIALKLLQNNWYEYNKRKKLLKYGQIPKKYAIACWKYLSFSGMNDNFEEVRLAIVDEVIGTDIIKINEYPHGESDKYPSWHQVRESDFSLKKITNPDYNWGQDKTRYKFLGFIYLLDDAEINFATVKNNTDGPITVSATASHKYSTILFGTTDIKHYNKLRIIYDLNVHNIQGNISDLTCGINISVSNQVVNCHTPDEEWRTTGFNPIIDYNNDEDSNTHTYPFPFGSLQLHNENLKDLAGKGIKSYDKTFDLTRCVMDGKVVNPFSIDGKDGLHRELPLYISITPISFEKDNASHSATVDITIKKIILYR